MSEAHLKAITSLDVSGGSNLDLGGNWFSLHGDITELKLGDFDGMSNLTSLRLDDNELSSLPDGIFDKLTNLETLNLSFNQLSSLPDDIFDNLTNLTTLSLVKNQLSSLPDDIFDNLTNLTTLNLSGNQLSSLPDGLFENLTNLTFLNLLDNPLSPLPAGIFDNLPDQKTVHLPPAITPTPLPEAGEVTPVADRTPQVRDAIVAAAGVNSAADVTAEHLVAITELDMQEANIAALKQGDFDNLTNLELLALNGTFSSFPDGIFDNLTNLETLGLSGTFSSLPDGIFDNLTNLTGLVIISPQLSSLPAGIFDNLTNLQRFGIGNTQLRSLPAGIFDNFTNVWFMNLSNNQLSSLPNGIFDKATMILDLSNNQLSSLPDGIFEGIFDEPPDLTGVEIFDVPLGPIPEDRLAELGEYTTLNLTGNLVDPLPLTISLERVADGQFKAVATAGAPYELVLPIRVASGSIVGGAESITIPVGSVESDTFTVTRTPGTTFAVSVDIETLPGLWRNHSGYTLVKSADLPLAFPELGGHILTPVSQRSPQVRDAIVAAVPGVDNAVDVTETHLAAITRLTLELTNPTKAGDFDGLTGLTVFAMGTDLTSLPAGFFNEFSNLTVLWWEDFQLSSLPAGVFDNLTNLTELNVGGVQLSSLPDGIFDQLANLTELNFEPVKLTSLPDGIFDQLTNLTELDLNAGQLRSLPNGIFDNLSNLTELTLSGDQLSSLPSSILDQLSNLTELVLLRTQLLTLPDGLLSGLSSLTSLKLIGNAADPMPFTVSLEKVADGQFKAVAPSGTPFEIVLPISVTNGSINGGATTITIPAGSVESEVLTVTRTPGTTFAVTADIDTVPGLPANHSGYTLAKSVDLPLMFTEFGGTVFTPVSERTPQVRDAIVNAVPGINSASDVTAVHLAAINPLSLAYKKINALKAEDFDGLSALVDLRLDYNNLTTLPDGIFDGVPALKYLNLIGNKFTTLPDGIFDGLSSLKNLRLATNQLSSLPENIFDGLSALNILELDGNALTTIPQSVSGLTALTHLYFSRNRLRELPNGVFAGLPSLTQLHLRGNAVDPLPLTVSLEKVADGQFKAVAPAGAPFEIVLPISVTNGSINGGATTITIPAGSVESETLTVTRTPGTTFAVTVNIGTLPGLPANHSGYTLVKSEDLPLVLTELGETVFTPVSERTPQVRDAIVRAFVGINSANDVTKAHLAAIKTLNLSDKSITALKEGDFDGLSALTALYLHSNQLTSLPAGVFDGLSALTQLGLSRNQLTSLPAGVFDGLSSVVVLGLSRNQLTSLPAGVFDELSALTNLVLNNNQLTSLQVGVFDGLSTLTQLDLKRNQLTSLPTDVFDELSALTELWLNNNQLTSLSVGAFNGLSSLTQLLLNDNQLTTLPAGVFDGLSALTELWLPNNQLTSLSAGVFDELPALTQLYLDNNQLTSLSSDVFDGLSALTGLLLNNNQLTSLSAGVFDGLPALRTLHLHNNQLTSLLAGTFDELPALKYLHLEDNRLASLSAGVFDGLSALTQLWLNANQLTSLSAGVFDRLSALTILYLHDNQLTTLSAGVFDGLSALTILWLNGNVVAPMPLTVSLEQVGTDQFKAVAPAGAPFEIVLPVSVTNGSITGGATTITIPTGSVESDTLTVTRTAGTSDDITVDIGTVPGIPSNHNGYALVKSTDLPLTFTAPSETTTTLMAIKGTVTNEDGTPAEAGLEVTVTIGSTTQTAVSEAGGVYSVIFLNTQGVVATSGDTVTVQVLNPNTGATTERTVSLSSEQIIAKKATIDLQFSPSGREYLLSVPEGISLIHVPLKVTAVGGVAQTIESVGDLYDALGGAATVSLLITLDPQAQRWVGYFASGDRGSSADKVLTDDLGIIAVLTAAVSVQLSGDGLGTNGRSSITLHPGMNLVGVPLKDSRITRVTDLFALEGIKDNVSLTLVSDNGEIKLVERAGDSGDIPVTGGQSFILVAREAATVAISGTGWSNVPDPAVAPSTALTGIEVRDTTPVLAMSGSILPPVGGASLPRLGVTDFSVTVKNLSTGKVDTSVTDNDGISYQFTFVDIETGRAAQVGDILEITAQSPNPLVGVQPLRYVVTVEDVKRSHIPLAELVAYEIPATTELLLNYPNPFNPETWIPYRLAKDAFVTLTVYDSNGRVVRQLEVGHRIAAVYESRSEAIYWDGRTEFGERVASGIYFYTLTAGDYSATRKMVILK